MRRALQALLTDGSHFIFCMKNPEADFMSDAGQDPTEAIWHISLCV